MAFLPEGYEPPKTNSNYIKFEDGKKKIRIMSSPILGWQYWDKVEGGSGKPIRLPYTEDNGKKAIMEASKNIEERDRKAKHFWAVIAYDYVRCRIGILQIDQKSVQDQIRQLSQNEEWGSPVDSYDITVTREGKDLETKYTITPSVPRPASDEVKEAFKSTFIDLEALYAGADPFDKNWKDSVDIAPESVFA